MIHFSILPVAVKNKGKPICNSSNDVISCKFDSEKVDQN
jgi:hypothetical protein